MIRMIEAKYGQVLGNLLLVQRGLKVPGLPQKEYFRLVERKAFLQYQADKLKLQYHAELN